MVYLQLPFVNINVTILLKNAIHPPITFTFIQDWCDKFSSISFTPIFPPVSISIQNAYPTEFQDH